MLVIESATEAGDAVTVHRGKVDVINEAPGAEFRVCFSPLEKSCEQLPGRRHRKNKRFILDKGCWMEYGMSTNLKRKSCVWIESDFEIKDSAIEGIGKGLFTLRTINRGDTIGPYTGMLLHDEQCNCEPYVNSHYTLWLCNDHNIVAEGENASYTRYINHSDKPNAQFVVSTRWKKARVEAIQRILPGEEIFIDYGPHFWESVGIEKKSVK